MTKLNFKRMSGCTWVEKERGHMVNIAVIEAIVGFDHDDGTAETILFGSDYVQWPIPGVSLHEFMAAVEAFEAGEGGP